MGTLENSFDRMMELKDADVKRQKGNIEVGFNSRVFVLCGMPYKQPDQTTWIRKNGNMTLKVSTFEPNIGLPYGQDRLIPMYLATRAIKEETRVIAWEHSSEILDLFNLDHSGRSYKRLIDRFKRVFNASIKFETEIDNGAFCERGRILDKMKLWFEDDKKFDESHGEVLKQYKPLPKNAVVLSEEFYNELTNHPMPVDLDVVRALKDSPGAMDFYTWIVYRAWKLDSTSRIPIFGEDGLSQQLGMKKDQEKYEIRRRLRRWLSHVKQAWSDCQAHISEDGEMLVLSPGEAIAQSKINPQQSLLD